MLALPASLGLAASRALSQPSVGPRARWVLVPTRVQGAASASEDILGELAQTVETQGLVAVDGAAAALSLEASYPREPAAVTAEDHDLVARESQSALIHVATGQAESARRAANRVLDRANDTMESLQRELRSARLVLDACLYRVRAELDSRQRDAARALVLECRRLVPDLEPDSAEHPPSVLELLARAEAELAQGPHATLSVRSSSARCPVYLNGRNVGVVPWDSGALPAGEYRVQVECAGAPPGRVHRVVLGRERVEITVDARFEAAVRTRPALVLRYLDAAEAARRRFEDGLRLGHMLGVNSVLLVTGLGGRAARIDRIDVARGRVMASVVLDPSGQRRDDRPLITAAVQALRDGRSVDLSGGAVEVARWDAPGVAPLVPQGATGARVAAASGSEVGSAARPAVGASGDGAADTVAPEPVRDAAPYFADPVHVVSVAVGAAGVLTLGAGWVLAARQTQLNEDFTWYLPQMEGFIPAEQRVDRNEWWLWATGFSGGLLTTGSLPFALPDAAGVPWWAWVSGVAGLGATVGAMYIYAEEPGCLDPICMRQTQNDAFATLLLGNGVPLLAVPVVYGLRSALGRSARARAASVFVSGGFVRGTVRLNVGGEF